MPETGSTEATLRLSDVFVRYVVKQGLLGSRRSLNAVDGVTFEIARGEVLGLVGESGSGKSTAGRVAVGSERPSSGRVEIEGEPVPRINSREWRAQRRLVQVVHQDPESALNPQRPVGEQVGEPLVIHGIGGAAERRERVRRMLVAVGMQDFAGHYPHQLSGGQMQRIVIARALVMEPRLLICDEPVSALDVSVQAQVVNLLQDIQKQLNLTILFISHDLGIVRHVSDRIAVMYLGRIVEIGPAEEVFTAPRHPYTRALLSAIPASAPWDRRPRIKLQGEPPTPLDPPSGCTFHPRCAYAAALCSQAPPALEHDDQRATACHFWRDLVSGCSDGSEPRRSLPGDADHPPA